ncbi:hypothetical protein GQ55_3G078000 [Panicum hallii var. hallii]|uniref:Uncharacterized protein n=1 Tax=Panicum hallii var. hallii TaxID=1504633 RepID=A0A2T7E6Y0_9POAL|nr:hypothetical protein GQ55_3G078000 [Panicum hallii var. hallii]
MASSHKIVIGLFVLLLLTSSPSMLQAARMVPGDHARADQAHVKESVPASPIATITTAPPMPPSPPSGKPDMAVVAKRWGTTQVTDGSVPSPGVGH